MKSSPEPEYTLELSEEAADDIRDILQYTFDTYGEEQLLTYKVKLNKALEALLRSPSLGHKRSDLPPEYDAYPAGEHIIIFSCSSGRHLCRSDSSWQDEFCPGI